MRVRTLQAAIVVAALMQSLGATAQRQGLPGPGRGGNAPPEFAGPPQGPDDLPIVEVVGCLTEGSTSSTWLVTKATEPVRSTPGFSKAEELRAAETKAFGSLQFRLIGLVELGPSEHKGHKVAVKGMLIKDAAETRLNVTSLMTASPNCDK